MKKHLQKIIFPLLVLGLASNLLAIIYSRQEVFFSRTSNSQYESLKRAYFSSQYVQKKNPVIINDEIFEQFAGAAFLRGLNPILIVHDHPPLGRYIVSLSIIFFDNASTLILFLMGSSFVGIFLIANLVCKNKYLSLIPLAIFMNEPLILNKFVFTPLPEPIQLPFIIFAIYFFLLSFSSKRKTIFFVTVSLLLGVIISTRFFVTGACLTGVMMIFLTIFKKSFKDSILFFLTLPLALCVLFASYARTIMDGYSLIDILGIQKYILFYHKSKFINPFSFWDLILFNRWHTWWDGNKILSDIQWSIIWPVSVAISYLSVILGLMKKIKLSDYEIFLALWVTGYSSMLSAGYTSTRYFMPILPFFYILTISFVFKICRNFIYNKKHR